MKLKQLASNMTELELNNGTLVLFSYETPVCGFIGKDNYGTGISEGTYIETKTKYSRTTTKHINKWFELKGIVYPTCMNRSYKVDQSVLDELVK